MILQTETEYLISEKAATYGQSKYIGIHALASVANSLAAAGASCSGVGVQITLPPYAYKSKLHSIQKDVKRICREQKLSLLEITADRQTTIAYPMVQVTGVGRAPLDAPLCGEKGRAGQELVLTGWVGMDGMLQIVQEKDGQLKERFAPSFLKQIQSYRQKLFALHEIDVAKAMGVSVVRQVTEGGILAALWDLAKEMETGLEADMKSISILQETVEVCEHFRLNPYQLISAGTLLMVTDDGEVLADALHREGIEASIIGRLTDNNDKVIHNGEDMRYIDRPAPDEIWKIYDGGR